MIQKRTACPVLKRYLDSNGSIIYTCYNTWDQQSAAMCFNGVQKREKSLSALLAANTLKH